MQRIKKLHDDLYVIDDILEDRDFFNVLVEFRPAFNNWVFNKRDDIPSMMGGVQDLEPKPKFGNLNKHTYAGLGDNLVLIKYAEVVKYTAMKLLKKKLHLERLNTNIQFANQHSSVHTDGASNQWTICLFVSYTWNEEWGGPFHIFIDDEEYMVGFKPCRAVLFRADHGHKGFAPSSMCPDPRFSVAFTYTEDHAMIDRKVNV